MPSSSIIATPTATNSPLLTVETLKGLYDPRGSSKLTDVVFRISSKDVQDGEVSLSSSCDNGGDGVFFHAHKLIFHLRGLSKLLELCTTNTTTANTAIANGTITNVNNTNTNTSNNCIPIPDMDQTIFEKVLKFIYNVDELRVENSSEAKNLLRAAVRFDYIPFKDALEELIVCGKNKPANTTNTNTAVDILNATNAASFYVFGNTFSCWKVKETAMEFMTTNFVNVMDSDQEGWTDLQQSLPLLKELLYNVWTSPLDSNDKTTNDGAEKLKLTSLLTIVDETPQLYIELMKSRNTYKVSSLMAGPSTSSSSSEISKKRKTTATVVESLDDDQINTNHTTNNNSQEVTDDDGSLASTTSSNGGHNKKNESKSKNSNSGNDDVDVDVDDDDMSLSATQKISNVVSPVAATTKTKKKTTKTKKQSNYNSTVSSSSGKINNHHTKKPSKRMKTSVEKEEEEKREIIVHGNKNIANNQDDDDDDDDWNLMTQRPI